MKTVNTFARQFSFSLMMAMTLGSAVVSVVRQHTR